MSDEMPPVACADCRWYEPRDGDAIRVPSERSDMKSNGFCFGSPGRRFYIADSDPICALYSSRPPVNPPLVRHPSDYTLTDSTLIEGPPIERDHTWDYTCSECGLVFNSRDPEIEICPKCLKNSQDNCF